MNRCQLNCIKCGKKNVLEKHTKLIENSITTKNNQHWTTMFNIFAISWLLVFRENEIPQWILRKSSKYFSYVFFLFFFAILKLWHDVEQINKMWEYSNYWTKQQRKQMMTQKFDEEQDILFTPAVHIN